ncbi:MAG: hypothetical protein JO327_02710 [Nitrososphaeraceae archaeon]|nr:hypothetical protein [Nitrososphaeraceae archaeon]MBV9667021.1 hypothetical protein [Nitrososphaeraceae archaeon]
MDLISRIGNVGKFMAMDLLDRLSIIGSTLSSNLDKMTEEEQNKYRQFLQKELKKLEKEDENSYSNKQNISLA